MHLREVGDLLTLIEQLSTRPFPPGAASAWHLVLEHTDASDARRAVVEYFNAPQLPTQPIHPGWVRAQAGRIRDRRGESTRAIERRQENGTAPNAAYLAFRRELERRHPTDPARRGGEPTAFGAMVRRREPVPAREPDPGEEAERARQLAGLAARSAA